MTKVIAYWFYKDRCGKGNVFNLCTGVAYRGASQTDDNGSANIWEMGIELVVYEDAR